MLEIFSPLQILISPRNQVQIRRFLIPCNRFEVYFLKITMFGIIFDAIPREIDDLAVSSRQFPTRMLRTSKNRSFYSTFWCNRPIETIDDYDGTVHRGPFQKSRSHPITIDGPDAL